jgi:predicted ATP-dependent endonuclease of OLD family
MKIRRFQIHNFRSIADATVDISDYTLLVGANNAGKSNLLNALRAFYDDIKWSADDVPKLDGIDAESWIELTFAVDGEDWDSLADKYKNPAEPNTLKVRRYFRSAEKDRVKSGQSNIYGYVEGALESDLFYGAKNVSTAKIGQVIYIPALTTADEQTKLSGPSPLRNVLNFLLKKVVKSSESYAALAASFQKLNEEARGAQGFLNQLAEPLNKTLAGWNIKIDLSIETLEPEDISKNLVSFAFLDASLPNAGLDLSRYGHGFQRSVIYELIRLAPTFQDVKEPKKKEFSPDLTIILFEEPEAFLHPAQQENMARQLRALAADPTQQVILCTHSAVFVGKATANITQLVRFRRDNGRTTTSQVNNAEQKQLFVDGGQLLAALQTFVADPNVANAKKTQAKKIVKNPPQSLIAEAEERFRYQLWLDGERSALFFADRVLLVEGASERALFNYLLSDAWSDLSHHRICVVDVLGKFNFHRYMSLLKAFKVPYGIILDDDNNNDHHQAINDLVDKIAAEPDCPILAPPQKITDCLEVMLGLTKMNDRADRKPLEIMKAITTQGVIDAAKLAALRSTFENALALTT